MISVYGLQREYLGSSCSFGEAKRIQKDSLPDDLAPFYYGIGFGGQPLFDSDMPDDLMTRYGID